MSRVVIIEDDPLLSKLYELNFELEGFEVVLAEDGCDGIREMLAAPPDLIVLDVTLPDISGIALLQFIRSDDALRDVPVFILSGLSRIETVRAARDAGATRFLIKGVCTPATLVVCAKEALAEAEALLGGFARGQQSERMDELRCQTLGDLHPVDA